MVNPEPQQARQVLDLTIDNIPVEHQDNKDRIFLNDNVRIEENSALFNALNSKQAEPGINFSGKLLTDNNADENTGILNTIDGIQLKFKGRFE